MAITKINQCTLFQAIFLLAFQSFQSTRFIDSIGVKEKERKDLVIDTNSRKLKLE